MSAAKAAPRTEPERLRIARRYLGQKEIAGTASNPTIAGFFARVAGKAMTDETPWCAAFVGNCLAEAGERGTGKLNARSYLDWGVEVPSGFERPGDIAVFSRGGSVWQGHVAFFLRFIGDLVEVLGGNQADGVSIARYPKGKLLGIRRPQGETAVRGESQAEGLDAVQAQLAKLGYQPGKIDGKWGTRTRGAVLALRADNGLPLKDNATDADFLHALFVTAHPREIAPERATASLADLRANGSRTVAATDAVKAAGATVTAAGVAGGALQQSGVLDTVRQAGDAANQVSDAAAPIQSLFGLFADWWWIPAIAVGGVVIWFGAKAAWARLSDHRTGKTA